MSNLSIIQLRKRDLNAVYKNIISASRGVGSLSRDTILSLVSEQPAPRFYITPFTAQLYITGVSNTPISPQKKAMVEHLIGTYNRLVKENPNAQKQWLYEVVVEQPAKSFYISKHRIKEIIFNYTGRNGKKK